MRRRTTERGEGNLGCFLWLLVLVLVAIVLWKAVPVKMANAELYSYMEDLTKFAPNESEAQLRKMILNKARELNLPVKAKQIQVERSRDRIKLRCTYTILLELPGYTYEWKVDHLVDRAVFYL